MPHAGLVDRDMGFLRQKDYGCMECLRFIFGFLAFEPLKMIRLFDVCSSFLTQLVFRKN